MSSAYDSEHDDAMPSKRWRGNVERPKVAKYGWQRRDAGRQGTTHLRSSRPWRFPLFVIGFVALLAWMLSIVLQTPTLTPVIALTSALYKLPLPPNAWSEEDLGSLESLDGKSIRLDRIVLDHRVEPVLEQLRASLSEASAKPGDRLIVYVNVHGAVDESGNPCLIPPGTNPFNCATWLPLQRVLDEVNRTDQLRSREKLVILDCVKSISFWEVGAASNTFLERVQQRYASNESRGSKTSILTSCRPGECSGSSADLKGSAFGQFLALGLAGLGDQETLVNLEPLQESQLPNAEARDGRGNQDRLVSLHELTSYVQIHVNRWSRANRGRSQFPVLLSNGEDASLVAVLNQTTQKRMRERLEKSVGAQPAVTDSQVQQLWRAFAKVSQNNEFLRFAPRGYDSLRLALLHLEQAAKSGSGYSAEARRLREELEFRISRLDRASSKAADSNQALAHRWEVFHESLLNLPTGRAHELPAAVFLGQQTSRQATALRHELNASSGGTPLVGRDDLKSEFGFFDVLRRYCVLERWTDKSIVEGVVDLRHRANQLAVPIDGTTVRLADERAHHWIRSILEQADTHRRHAQDLLLAGELADRAPLDLAREDSQQLLDTATQQLKVIEDIFALRDQLFADLPYVMRWSLDPERLLRTPASGDTEPSPYDVAKLEPLLEQFAALVQYLDNGCFSSDDSAHTVERLQQIVRSVMGSAEGKDAAGWSQLQRALQAEIQYLLQCEVAAEAVPRMEQILRVASLPTEERASIRARHAQFSAELNLSYFHTEPAAERVASERAIPRDEGAFLSRWSAMPKSPMLVLFNEPGALDDTLLTRVDDESPVARMERDAWILRQHLFHLNESQINRDITSDPTEDYLGVLQAERGERATSGYLRGDTQVDAVESRLRLHLQQWLLWTSERAILDFQGPEHPNEAPLFSVIANDYLRAADAIWPVADIESRRLGLETLVSQLPSLIAFHVTENGTTDSLLSTRGPTKQDSSSVPTIEQRVHGSVGPIATSKIAPIDLAGAASLLTWTEDNKNMTAVQVGSTAGPVVPIPGDTMTFHFTVPSQVTRLAAVFRGHEFGQSLEASTDRGIRIITRPTPPGRAEITVQQEQQEIAMLLLVDGSSSMRSAMAEGDGSAGPTKIDGIKSAVRALSEQLRQYSAVRWGVIFYGHRVGYSVHGEPEAIRVHPAYLSQIPDSLLPSNDVQEIIPLGRFDTYSKNVAEQELAKLTGWGQSPHYQAMMRAVEAFANDSTDSQKGIIWFTDGDDLGENAETSRPLESISWFEVIDGVKRAGVPIHVISPGDAHPADRTALAEIVEASGGSRRGLDRIDSLLREVLSQPNEQEFVVKRDPARSSYAWPMQLVLPSQASPTKTKEVTTTIRTDQSHTTEPLTSQHEPRADASADASAFHERLGQSIMIDMVQPESLLVEAGGISQYVPIAGGESIDLLLVPGRNMFQVPEYRRQFARELPLVSAVDSKQVGISAFLHRPNRHGNALQWQVSLQRPDNGFVARPNAIWIEVTPLGANNDPHPLFPVYDTSFASVASVPVLQWETPNWPADAKSASVQIWLRPHGVNTPELTTDRNGGQRVPLAKLTDQDEPFMHAGQVAIVAMKRLEPTGDLVVEVTEQHLTNSSLYGRLSIQLEVADKRPVLIERRYDAQRQVVRHQFALRGVQEDSGNDCWVRIDDRASVETEGWRSDPATTHTIPIPQGADLLRAHTPRPLQYTR